MRENASKQNVPIVNPKFVNVFSKGWNKMIAAAATNPALAAKIPCKDARIGLNFLRLSQIRIMKNIKNVPGRKMPAADMNAPIILPVKPKSRMANAPM